MWVSVLQNSDWEILNPNWLFLIQSSKFQDFLIKLKWKSLNLKIQSHGLNQIEEEKWTYPSYLLGRMVGKEIFSSQEFHHQQITRGRLGVASFNLINASFASFSKKSSEVSASDSDKSTHLSMIQSTVIPPKETNKPKKSRNQIYK